MLLVAVLVAALAVAAPLASAAPFEAAVGAAVFQSANLRSDPFGLSVFAVPDYAMPDAGNITAWRFVAQQAGSIVLQVYRPAAGGFALVASHGPVSVESAGQHTVSLMGADIMAVQAGDVLGWYNPSISQSVVALAPTSGTPPQTALFRTAVTAAPQPGAQLALTRTSFGIYQIQATLVAEDINECVSGLDNCHPNADCTNNNGSFSCACKTGFEGDGVLNCSLVDAAASSNVADRVAATEVLLGAFQQPADGEAAAEIAPEQRENVAKIVAGTTDLLSADDTEAISAAAFALDALTAGAAEELTDDTRTAVTDAANDLITLQKERADAAAAAGHCANGLCNPIDHCDVCPTECGSCTQVGAAPGATLLTSRVQWQAGAAGFGISDVDAMSTVGNDLTLTVFSRTRFLAAFSTGADPTALAGFLGVVFEVSSTTAGAAVEQAVEHVTVGLAELTRPIVPGDSLSYHFLNNSEWLPCTLGAAQVAPKLESTLFTSALCPAAPTSPGSTAGAVVYGLFSAKEVRSVEGNVVASLGEAIVTAVPGTPITGADGVVSLSVDSAERNAARTINDQARATLGDISALLMDGATVDGAPATLDTPSLSLELSKTSPESLDAGKSVLIGGSEVKLPTGLGAALGSQPVVTEHVVYKNNVFSFSTSSEDLRSDVVEFTFKSEAGSVLAVNNLASPAELTIPSQDAPAFQKRCQFFDPLKVDDGCVGLESECLGAWSTEGVELVETGSDGTATVCRTTHFSSFGIGIDFTIAPPKISATNFDLKNSALIYYVWSGFIGVALLATLYSWNEKRLYDKRQLGIELGTIIDDEIRLFKEPIPSGWRGWLLVRVFTQFKKQLKEKHNWIAVMWPTGRKVYPKRDLKVYSLVASTSLAFGLNAVFAYTATVSTPPGEERTVNTLAISTAWGDTRVPLEGLYSFVMALPLTLLLSMAIGNHFAYLDILRKVAPRRFRALTPLIRAELSRRGMWDDASQNRKAALANKTGTVDQFGWPMADGDKKSDSLGSQKKLALTPHMTRRITTPFEETSSMESNAMALQLLGGDPAKKDELINTTNIGVVELFDEVTLGGPDATDAARTSRSASPATVVPMFVEEYDSDADSDDDTALVPPQLELTKKAKKELARLDFLAENEFSEEVEELVRCMKRWKRRAYFMAGLIFFTGLLFTFLWAGSLNPAQQRRWLAGFGEFLTISAVITAPLFILIASACTAYYERTNRESQLKAEREAQEAAERAAAKEAELLAQQGGQADTGNAAAEAKAKASAVTKAQVQALIQRELGRNVRQQLLAFNIF